MLSSPLTLASEGSWSVGHGIIERDPAPASTPRACRRPVSFPSAWSGSSPPGLASRPAHQLVDAGGERLELVGLAQDGKFALIFRNELLAAVTTGKEYGEP